MKYISLIIVISLFVGFANAQKPGARLLALGLKGKVKQVTEYVYKDVEYISNLRTPEKHIENFDEKGNQLDETVYTNTGLIKKTVFIYTKEKIIQRQYLNGKLNGTFVQIYDDNGHEIELDMSTDEDTSEEIPMPKMNSRTIVKYDKKGNKAEEDEFLNGTKLTGKTTFVCNDEYQIVEEDRVRYFSTGVKKEKSINKYDSAGNKIKSETYDLLGKLIDEYTVSHDNLDQHGNWQLMTFIMKMHSQPHDDSLYKVITKREIVYFR